MKQFTSASGFVAVELTCADIPVLLDQLVRVGIPLFRVHMKDLISAVVWVRRRDLNKLVICAEKFGSKVKTVQRTGIYWISVSLLRRPIMLIGITLILLISWWIPTKVLFVQVEGNTNIPTRLILEKASECGITFGAKRRDVRSEKMKNSLLASIPGLQWTGINTYGCTAVISVQERSEPEQISSEPGVSSIVADRDGIIYSCTVTRGNQLCAVGQAVNAGETLVSGYTDCGIKIQATRAEAEIYAKTIRQLTVKTPLDYTIKGDLFNTVKKYSLIIGKKRINFSKDSGICTATCDKMYSQYNVVLPGGHQLPVAIAVEHIYQRKTDPVREASQVSQVYAEEFAKRYLFEQMLSGVILKEHEQTEVGNTVYTLKGRYVCLEMIGRERSEEIFKHNG